MSNRYQGGFITASYNGLKVPDAPTIGTATAGNLSASVTFTAPSNVGGGAITGYTVISSPGSITGTGTSSPVTVSGLSNGTAYTFTVVATNAYGTGPASAASNSATPAIPVTSTVEYLVVAGGGGGGDNDSGGGGAGGFRTATGLSVSAGSPITVTVGGGGAYDGYRGTDSVFGSITSTAGGGGGGSSNAVNQENGGSGGGRGGLGNTPATSPSQGNNGGGGRMSGGGGASQVGFEEGYPTGGSYVGSDRGGKGGNGTASSISGSSVTYAGGGGGYGDILGGNPGTGGGGFGTSLTNDPPSTAGTANTGGGGGAGRTGAYVGKAGGSGIVIIRYADSFAAATSTTGSPTITVAGGYRVYQWTSSGSITF